MIYVDSIRIKRKTKNIIRNVSFKVPAKTVYGIIGDNGIGKTTLLKALVGIIQINDGNIQFPHENFHRSDKIGYFINSDCFDPQMTGYENLFLLLSYKGIKNVHELLNKEWPLDMDNYKNIKVKKYSQGTLQKLGIISATISPSYSLIVLDEPHNSLDPGSIYQLRSYIESLNKNGATVVISSHTIGELTKVCDKILVMKKNYQIDEISRTEFSNIEVIIRND